jgi:RimJ/RimL family protein N-acetyltransferase
MFELYQFNKQNRLQDLKDKFILNPEFVLAFHKITFLNFLAFPHPFYNLYWIINAKGKCWLYRVSRGSDEAHYSYVTKKSYKFPFMKESDFQLGNCFTHEEFRGLGIYSFVIIKVVENHLNINNLNEIYMLIDEKNVSSKKGAEKAGFQRLGQMKTKRLLGLLKVYSLRILNAVIS